MQLSKIQEKNLNTVIRKCSNYFLCTRDDIYYTLMGYKCFQNESDEFINNCINHIENVLGLNYEIEVFNYGI